MASFIRPTIDALQREIDRFRLLDRDEYLKKFTPRRGGRTYFIVVDDHFIDMKAVWYGACRPKPNGTPHSPTIRSILDQMGFVIVHEKAPEASRTIIAIEKHKRIEKWLWTHSGHIAEERRKKANGRCEACGLHHADRYVGIDGSLLDVHHLRPFSSLSNVNKHPVGIDDVVALCANCHRMIHALGRQRRRNPSLREFKSTIR
jgi:hypothetical protein